MREDLLELWCGEADPTARETFRQDLQWVRRHVSARLTPALRRLGDTDDVVQEAVLHLLRQGPRFRIRDRGRFRALFARIVENILCDRFRYLTAKKRSVDGRLPSASCEVIDLDRMAGAAATPSSIVARAERVGRVRLALELLEPPEREVIVLRQIEERPFAEVGRALGVSEDAARMRFQRALARLASRLRELRGCQGEDRSSEVEEA